MEFSLKFWNSDSYFLFHDVYFHNCHGGRVFPRKNTKNEKFERDRYCAEVPDFFMISVTAVTVKSVTGRQFYHLPNNLTQLSSIQY